MFIWYVLLYLRQTEKEEKIEFKADLSLTKQILATRVNTKKTLVWLQIWVFIQKNDWAVIRHANAWSPFPRTAINEIILVHTSVVWGMAHRRPMRLRGWFSKWHNAYSFTRKLSGAFKIALLVKQVPAYNLTDLFRTNLALLLRIVKTWNQCADHCLGLKQHLIWQKAILFSWHCSFT